MKRTHRILSVLLAALLVASSLASCNDEQIHNDTTETAETDAVNITETEPTETEPRYSDALSFQDFGGASFRIATGNGVNGTEMDILQNIATEETGEIINDSLFARDLWLEENYNIDVIYQNMDDWDSNKYKSAITAGDCPYELILEETGSACVTLAQQGMLFPLNMVDGLALEEDYWFPELNKTVLMGTDMYFSVTAISPRLYAAAGIVTVNRDLVKDIGGMPDLYESVKEGTWTMDQMFACSKLALVDLNGDGEYNDQDRFGFLAEIMTSETMVMGAGYQYLMNDGEKLRITLEEEGMFDLLKKIETILIDPSTLYNDDSRMDFVHIIETGNCLFRHTFTSSLENYREYDYDYGLLPFPKYTEDQKEYYCYANPWLTDSPMFPITIPTTDLSFSGVITNAMAAYGYDYIRPAVFDTVLKHRDARDEATAEIIDIMYENIMFSLSATFWNTLYQEMGKHFSYGVIGSQEVTSRYAGIKQKAESENQSVIDKFNQYHEKFISEFGLG